MEYNKLQLPVLVFIMLPTLGWADYRFDPTLLESHVDMAILSEGHPPGTYFVQVLLNGRVVDSQELAFERAVDGSLQTCLSKKQLFRYGIKVDEYPALAGQRVDKPSVDAVSEQCVDISAIPQAAIYFDFYSQQLLISVPQLALMQDSRGGVPQDLWDDGITALLMNYRISVNRARTKSCLGYECHEQWSAILEPGLNFGAWRIRNASNWQPGQWQYAYTFAERGVNDWKSRLSLGERFSSSYVFDSVPLTGIILATDEEMVPYEQRVYGPVVRGNARSQAVVEVRQNGYLVFSTTVAPGPFELNELSIGGSSGALEVTVLESDGPPQVFNVTYATPAIALRERAFKYEWAGGYYRSARLQVEKAPIGQFSLMYGLPLGLTSFGGGQFSSHYRVSALGLGVSLGILGAISLDSSHGRWQQRGCEGEGGEKWRLLYSKYMEQTQSWFSLESNIYSANGFRTIADVLDSYSESAAGSTNNCLPLSLAKRATSVTLGQSMAGWGNINIAAIQNRYQDNLPSNISLRFSYGMTYRRVSLSLDWSKSYKVEWGGQSTRNNNQVGLRISHPLSFGQSTPVYISYQFRDGNNQDQQHEIGVRGDAFERRMTWDVREQQSFDSVHDEHGRSALYLGWNGQYNSFNVGYGHSRDSRQMNANLAGGIVLHDDGLTLGQPLGQTVGLVVAPDAADMEVGSWPGVKTDTRGYTTLGSLSPYQVNEVAVDPLSLPDHVSISQTEIKVVPTNGAVVPVQFLTKKGSNAMIRISRPDGTLIPFGAVVVEEGENRTGMSVAVVGYEGDVYVSGLQDVGRLLVRWGSAADQNCLVDYKLPKSPSGLGGLYELSAVCQ
ncbi:fimbria/pilus outer membrane usher protein [Aeromonas sp. R9-2]|uniref:fimbria/pilus outer membrane usher protein n=1 Tax=Aeromonas sp. R9-2 TaxID=3138479 RepID=UPI0034A56BCC